MRYAIQSHTNSMKKHISQILIARMFVFGVLHAGVLVARLVGDEHWMRGVRSSVKRLTGWREPLRGRGCKSSG